MVQVSCTESNWYDICIIQFHFCVRVRVKRIDCWLLLPLYPLSPCSLSVCCWIWIWKECLLYIICLPLFQNFLFKTNSIPFIRHFAAPYICEYPYWQYTLYVFALIHLCLPFFGILDRVYAQFVIELIQLFDGVSLWCPYFCDLVWASVLLMLYVLWSVQYQFTPFTPNMSKVQYQFTMCSDDDIVQLWLTNWD